MLIPVFKTGTHTAMDGTKHTYTADDLSRIAQTYNEQPEESKRLAPHVVGHPTTDAPAYGWVDKLVVQGDKLLASTEQFTEEFKKAVNDGLYKMRSISLYPNGLLRHVGWLGAAQPAVAGLGEVKFAADDSAIEFGDYYDYTIERGFQDVADVFSAMRDRLIEDKGVEIADKVYPPNLISNLRSMQMPDWSPSYTQIKSAVEEVVANMNLQPSNPSYTETIVADKNKPDENAVDYASQIDALTKELAAEKAANQAEKTANALLATKVQNLEQEAIRAQAASFAEQLVGEHKIAPSEKDYVIADLVLKANMPAFSEGGKTPLEMTKEHYTNRTPIVAAGRTATNGTAATAAGATDALAANFAQANKLSATDAVDEDRMLQYNEATKRANEKGISFADAVQQLIQEGAI